jgi:hypothetical protein
MPMRSLAFSLALFAGQLINMQSRPVVHLQPHKNTIEAGFDGSLLDLINAPAAVYLPPFPPKSNALGEPWSIDVRNLGPARVTISDGKAHFATEVNVGQTVHIYSNGTAYLLKR